MPRWFLRIFYFLYLETPLLFCGLSCWSRQTSLSSGAAAAVSVGVVLAPLESPGRPLPALPRRRRALLPLLPLDRGAGHGVAF